MQFGAQCDTAEKTCLGLRRMASPGRPQSRGMGPVPEPRHSDELLRTHEAAFCHISEGCARDEHRWPWPSAGHKALVQGARMARCLCRPRCAQARRWEGPEPWQSACGFVDEDLSCTGHRTPWAKLVEQPSQFGGLWGSSQKGVEWRYRQLRAGARSPAHPHGHRRAALLWDPLPVRNERLPNAPGHGRTTCLGPRAQSAAMGRAPDAPLVASEAQAAAGASRLSLRLWRQLLHASAHRVPASPAVSSTRPCGDPAKLQEELEVPVVAVAHVPVSRAQIYACTKDSAKSLLLQWLSVHFFSEVLAQ